jgi:pimeloyl-ACP methyl ester carboxylesterase
VPFITISGINLHYELHGDSGPPLVLVHGFTGDVTDWRHQIAEFSATHRMLVLDNRGHGGSQAPADALAYSIELMADDVEALAAHVGFERYHLVGHSMGGAIAQEIALRSPTRLLSLTLQDTSYWFGNLRLEMPDRPPALPPERLSEVMARLSRMSPDTLRAGWNALRNWPGTERRAAQITTPTLVVYGENDSPQIIAGSQRLTELIPASETCVISQAGHSPQEEHAAAFNTVLRRFLEPIPRPRAAG